MSTRQIFGKLLKNIRPVMYTSSTLLAYCTSEKCSDKPTNNKLQFEQLDMKKLTYEYMIKQSILATVNSTTQTLTVTYMAITALSNEYRTILCKLISLFEDTLTYDVNDKHWDLIVELRNKMQNKKEKLMSITSLLEYQVSKQKVASKKLSDTMEDVHKMAMAVSQLCFLYKMENLNNTLLQRLDDAMNKVKIEADSNKQLEHAYCRIQEQCIKNSKETTKK